jgi:transposase-like protein
MYTGAYSKMSNKWTSIRIREKAKEKVERALFPGESLGDAIDRVFPETDTQTRLDELQRRLQEKARQRAWDAYITKLREENEKNKSKVDAAAELLGIYAEEGSFTPAWDSDKLKKKR